MCHLKAKCYDNLGDKNQAIELCKLGTRLDPSNEGLKLELIHIYVTSGDTKIAAEQLTQLVKSDPLNCEAHRRLSFITNYDKNHWHYKDLKKTYSEDISKLSLEQRKCLHFALAKAEEDSNCIKEATFHLIEGNKLMNNEVSCFFNLNHWIEKAINFLEIDRALNKEISNDRKDLSLGKGLIFIVGMPRSGSTLIENILTMANKSIDLGETSAFQITVDYAMERIKKSKKISSKELNEMVIFI